VQDELLTFLYDNFGTEVQFSILIFSGMFTFRFACFWWGN